MTVLKNLMMQIRSSEQILANARSAVTKALDDIVDDETIPLFDRWCAFMEYSKVAYDIDSCVMDRGPARTLVEDNWYEPRRYQTIIFSDVFDELYCTEDMKSQYPEDVESIKQGFEKLDEESVRDLISSGSAGFIYDW